MVAVISLDGQTFGRLIVIDRAENGANGQSRWRCRCACGTITVTYGQSLRRGATRSCGCFRTENRPALRRTHGMSDSHTYRLWAKMHARCENRDADNFKYYGERGIRVCERWRSFENFLADMGEAPDGYSIERDDVNGDYEPTNCRWIKRRLQARNKTNSLMVSYRGETKQLIEWVELLELRYAMMQKRLQQYGWTAEKAFNTPSRRRS